jgi:hypothetical protein
MLCRVVRRDRLFIVRFQTTESPRQLAQGEFCLPDAQVACLLEGGEGVGNAGQGKFVRLDVEVADGVADQLSRTERILLLVMVSWEQGINAFDWTLWGRKCRRTVAGSSSSSIFGSGNDTVGRIQERSGKRILSASRALSLCHLSSLLNS